MNRIAILGAQESGVGAARLARLKGHEVFVSDAGAIKPKFREALLSDRIEHEEKGHSTDRILSADEIVKSPGIPDTVPIVKAALDKGIPVISEIEFAYRYCNGKIIGITGSNGKTTTTLLTHHILKKAGIDVAIGGNVGNSFAALVADRDHEYYVLELSSFQLDGIRSFNPNVAILLNITPDHLDRYEYRMEKYAASKFRITMNQQERDHFIYCDDDPEIRKGIARSDVKASRWPFSIQHPVPQGAFLENDQITFSTHQTQFTMSLIDQALKGKHNVYNSMAAGIAARVLEIRSDIIRESLSDFQNVEHRLEHVAMVNGIEFINDSKATNVNSTWYALESMTKPVIWVVGGVDKGNDYTTLRELVRSKVKTIVCLGKENDKIHKAFGGVVKNIVETGSAEQAVRTSYELAEPGDVVLLSPACASFDLFENYEDRGRRFKKAVRSL